MDLSDEEWGKFEYELNIGEIHSDDDEEYA
jgi:hypothetical protein